jgi:hypothetical protein
MSYQLSSQSRLVVLRSPTRQSRYGDGASAATKDLLRPPLELEGMT